MVRSSADIFSFYPNRIKRMHIDENSTQDFKLSKLQKQLLEFLNKDDPKSIEEFLSITTFKPQDALLGLTELELYGVVVKCPDSTYLLS